MKRLIAAIAAGAAIFAAPVAHAETPTECPTLYSAGYKGQSIGLPDPGGIFPWEGTYQHEQARLAAETVAAVDAYAESCPGADINIVGYSYGAAVVHTALEEINTRPYANRVHVNLYGNPRRDGGIEDTLSGIPLTGIVFRGPGINPENIGSFQDTCNPRDGICDFPHPLRHLIKSVDHVIGYFTGAHHYPDLIKEIA